MGDDAKGPGPSQQTGAPAADPEDAIAESMDESMDNDTTTVTTPAPHRSITPEYHDLPTGTS